VFGLQELLVPLAVGDFLEAFWERRSLYVPGGSDKFVSLYSLEAFYTGLSHVPDNGSPPVKVSAGYLEPSGRHCQIPLQPDQVLPMVGAGLAVHAAGLEATSPRLRALLGSLRRQLAVAADMDVSGFLSAAGTGYGVHYDATAMWILQIAGAKRWWYAPAPAVVFPHASRIPSAEEAGGDVAGLLREGELSEQVLRPGDLLYLPAGTWHRTCGESLSLHLSVGIRPASHLDLIHRALAPALLALPDWRHFPTFRAGLLSPEQLKTRAEAVFTERLRELRLAVELLTPEDLYRVWQEQIMAEAEGEPAGADAPLREPQTMSL
jgi:ribosomal protein L16 Arg81 hydroxylase